MQILEIYIHTIIYIHIHTYTTSSTTTTHHHPHHPHHRGEGGTDTFIYIHIQLLPPPPTTTHTTHTTGGRGVHHHPPPPPTPQQGGGYWGATIQTHNHGVGGGEVPSDAGPYIHYIQHYIQFLFSAIHNPWSNATNLPGRRLTGASLFKSGDRRQKKRLSFEECSMCINHRKYRQKWPWGGASLERGAEPKNS